MKVISAAAARAIDRRSEEEFGYTAAMLMEAAALRMWHEMAPRIRAGATLVVFCGGGNNGGDGLALARWAHHDGHQVRIVDCAADPRRRTALNRLQGAICAALGIPSSRWDTEPERISALIAESDYFIDAIAGIGIRAPLREPLQRLVTLANERHDVLYAIDVPSGLREQFTHTDSAMRAAATYTIGLPKQLCFTPLARPYCGEIIVVPIGFPPPLLTGQPGGTLLSAADIAHLYRPPSRFGHKHTRGVVALYAGGGDMIGAAIMAADGAAAAAAGLVHLYLHADGAAPATTVAVAPARPAYIVHSTARAAAHADQHPSSDRSVAMLPPGCDALCVGPGWGVTDRTRALLDRLIAVAIPMVIDADAITLLSEHVSLRGDALVIDDERIAAGALRHAVLTPHCAEFARLLAIDTALVLRDPLHYLRLAAEQLHAVIVLKSAATYISDPAGRYAILDGSEVTLATGGSGDVLAGVLTALLAQGYDRFHAAQLAALFHYRGAALARERHGYYRADQLAAAIAAVVLQSGC